MWYSLKEGKNRKLERVTLSDDSLIYITTNFFFCHFTQNFVFRFFPVTV